MHSIDIDARQSFFPRTLFGFLLSLCLPICFAACDKQDGIQSHVVKRQKTEMLAAVTHREKSVWYFKVKAPQTVLEEVHSQFDDFFRTIRWPSPDALKPKWTLPNNWKEEPASGLREATLTFRNHGYKFEVTVSHLPMRDDDWNKYLLENINRWRKQVLLEEWTQADLKKQSKSFDSGKDKIFLFDFVGYERTKRRVITQEDADRLKEQARPPITRMATVPTWETPAGWEKIPTSGIRIAAFRVRKGENKAEVTLISLPPSSILANVNRWRGQINLAPWTQAELDENRQEIAVENLKADYVELFEAEGKKKPRCILGGILVSGGKAWFFKLAGDRETGLEQRDNFKKFIGSIRF